ncbi:MraY family glycosyltransferase [Pigmentiphaga humi]|nr:MraY family glycosyltransferase [Pigmentiphaga humi]
MIVPEIWQKGGTAAILAFFAVLLLLPVARRFQLLDFPAGRKDHQQPTPVIGGLAMGIGIFAAEALYQLGTGEFSQEILAYATGGALLLAIGQLDDKYDLPWWLRICAQAIAALITATWGDVRAEHLGPLLGLGTVSLGDWSIPFTVFATVGLINALNMIDGMDGFAGSLCLTALLMLGAAALYSGNTPLAADIAPLCGALLAFLYFNMRFPWRKRAKVFMGNGGSAFLGFTVAWVAFRLTQTPGHPVSPTLALWLVPIPLIDCLVVMTHRIRRGTSPFKADHNHIHHLMRDAGVSPMRTIVTVCLFSLLTGLAAAQSLRAGFNDTPLLVAFAGLLVLWHWVTSKRGRALALLRPLGRSKEEEGIARAAEAAGPISMESDAG